MDRPEGFIPISTAGTYQGTVANLIGVVVKDVAPPTQTKGTDWCLSFTIQDCFDGQSDHVSTISCRIFRKNPAMLPKVTGIGDVIILRRVGINQFRGKCDAIVAHKHNSEVICFKNSGIPMPDSELHIAGGVNKIPHSAVPDSITPTLGEQMYAVELKGAAKSFVDGLLRMQGLAPKAPVAIRSGGQKLSLIKDLESGNFYDIRGQVVKVYSEITGVDLYITDYTENNGLVLHQDPQELANEDDGYTPSSVQKWQGPFGQLTLAIRLYDPHAAWATSNIREGDFVYVRNVRTKFGKSNKLEGALHSDRDNPLKVDIRKLTTQSDIDDINKRKAAYEKGRAAAFVVNEPKKASALKKEKKAKKKAQKEQEQQELQEKLEKEVANATGSNAHVRCSFSDVRLSTVSDILSNPARKITGVNGKELVLPFVNARYRSRLRVLDFYPSNLEDFSHCLDDQKWNKQMSKLNLDDDATVTPSPQSRWEWAFQVIVEDASTPARTAPDQMTLIVAADGAECLLKMDACDLRAGSQRQAVKELEEKLFILWGNLQELKAVGVRFPLQGDDKKKLKNKPFECIIEEYGYFDKEQHGEWKNAQRLHRMNSTTIIS
ncbi:hypothetical protein K469DRAFT_699768 [Zopfia rhizophila CBS 207.26]|uniref:Protection of telomeres protein 1 n=1 Tax=Zopfia rhizophila CBS 207.26 TaxID=1314779 RepID=A0A6A6EJ37_9PEZI|nr:hypothetical protein K469DRAFT_699768 [Zopfia rhizophila CBS 207.26]